MNQCLFPQETTITLFQIIMDKCQPLNFCLCCNSTNLKLVLDLNQQPLANSYCTSKDEKEDEFPLAVNFCLDCTHLQLTVLVNPDLLFKNYLYVSGTTKTLKDYFNWFAKFTESQFPAGHNLDVLDIACNDGSQLDSYKQLGHKTYGIDPAENLHPLSNANHEVVCDYFTRDSLNRLSNKKFDIIIGQNVFAHNAYPLEFLELAGACLKDSGKIYIQTSQADMIKYGQFDTIYHEHISFFSTKSFATLVRRAGLYLHMVKKTEIHGNSYVFIVGKNPKEDNTTTYLDNNPIEQVRQIDEMIAFGVNAKQTLTELASKIDQYRNQGLPIIGYGAAAKGNTVLNFGQVKLDYIVDDNPLKQGMFTPGQKIPIVSLDFVNNLYNDKPVAWIPLSWNFFREIKQKISSHRKQNDAYIQLNFAQL